MPQQIIQRTVADGADDSVRSFRSAHNKLMRHGNHNGGLQGGRGFEIRMSEEVARSQSLQQYMCLENHTTSAPCEHGLRQKMLHFRKTPHS